MDSNMELPLLVSNFYYEMKILIRDVQKEENKLVVVTEYEGTDHWEENNGRWIRTKGADLN